MNNQYAKYIDDLYEDLFIAINKGKLLEFKVKSRNFRERNFFYIKRHK